MIWVHLYGEKLGSLYVSGKLPTYPSPKPTLTITSHLGQNVGLGGGVGWQFPPPILREQTANNCCCV